MVEPSIQDDTLILEVLGIHKLWALKSRIILPLRNVLCAKIDLTTACNPNGLRGPGVHVRGLFTAGTFRHGRKKVFWDVQNPIKAIVIDLKNERYDQLVVEVDDPIRASILINGNVSTDEDIIGGPCQFTDDVF